MKLIIATLLAAPAAAFSVRGGMSMGYLDTIAPPAGYSAPKSYSPFGTGAGASTGYLGSVGGATTAAPAQVQVQPDNAYDSYMKGAYSANAAAAPAAPAAPAAAASVGDLYSSAPTSAGARMNTTGDNYSPSGCFPRTGATPGYLGSL
jgi:hypothetical protein